MNTSSRSGRFVLLFAAVAVFALLMVVLVTARVLTGGGNNTASQSSSSTSLQYRGGMGVQAEDGSRAITVNSGNTFKLVFVVDVEAGAVGSSVAEIILNYSPEVVTVQSISESSNLLALNKKIDNEQGVVTVDIANIGGANFTNGMELVEFTFTAVAAGVTEIKVAEGSTLGVPNVLDIQRLISTTVQVQ